MDQIACRKIRELLEKQKHQIFEQIRNYPRPIPACDQQFNFLLEQRNRCAEELKQLDELSKNSRENAREMIEQFLQVSTILDEHDREQIREALHADFPH